MSQHDQINLATELCAAIGAALVNHIRAGKIPEEWDGHELRARIAEMAAEAASPSIIYREPRCNRARNYKNHVIITDL